MKLELTQKNIDAVVNGYNALAKKDNQKKASIESVDELFHNNVKHVSFIKQTARFLVPHYESESTWPDMFEVDFKTGKVMLFEMLEWDKGR